MGLCRQPETQEITAEMKRRGGGDWKGVGGSRNPLIVRSCLSRWGGMGPAELLVSLPKHTLLYRGNLLQITRRV